MPFRYLWILQCVVIILIANAIKTRADQTITRTTAPQKIKTGFVENAGLSPQTGNGGEKILFIADRGPVQMFLSRDRISFVSSSLQSNVDGFSEATGTWNMRNSSTSARRRGFRLDYAFVGANPNVTVERFGLQDSKVVVYNPRNPDGVRLEEWETLVFKNLYRHIDLMFSLTADVARYQFIVHPGGDPRMISMRTLGCDHISVDDVGVSTMSTRFGGLRETAPYAFQPALIGQESIACRYVLDGNIRRFELAQFDPGKTLVIDPWITYFGGSADDFCNTIVTDSRNNLIFAGESFSWDLPVTPGAFQGAASTGSDAFLAKFDPNGNRRYVTYYGGSMNDVCYAVAVNTNGDMYMTGATKSTNFPIAAGAFQSTNKGGADMFIVKFDSNGVRQWATYYGDGGDDNGLSIAIDSSRNIVIGGHTTGLKFPVSTGAFQTTSGGWDDGFIVKFTPLGKRIWATLYGGAGGDRFSAVCIGPRDHIYLSGRTWSSNFPVTANAYQTVLKGTTNSDEATLVRMDSSGRRVWATYFGGDKVDVANGLTIDRNARLTFTGQTESTNLPVTPGAFQLTLSGTATDAFVTSFDTSGALRWSTYYGGPQDESGLAICSDSSNAVYFTGSTRSPNFPVTGGSAQQQIGGAGDAYLVKFDHNGNRQWASFYGGDEDDYGKALAAKGTNIFLCGITESYNLWTFNPFQPIKGSGSDGFIVLFTNAGYIPVELVSFSGRFDNGLIHLAWQTESEAGNFGFEVEREDHNAHGAWTTRGFVAGHGTTTQRQSYSFLDADQPGVERMVYRLKQLDFSGDYTYSQPLILSRKSSTASLQIVDVYPLPVNGIGNMSFYLPSESTVRISLYSSSGQRIGSEQIYPDLPAGYHRTFLETEGMPDGIYVLTIHSDAQHVSSMVVIRNE